MLQTKLLLSGNDQTQILQIEWLEYQPFMKLDLEENLFAIIDQVKSQHISGILFDPSNRPTNPPATDLIGFFELFLSGLSDTSLKKFARISVKDPETELQFRTYINQIQSNLHVNFSLAHFNTRAEARRWLNQ